MTETDGTTRTTTYQGFTTTFYDEENHKTVSIADQLGRITAKEVYTGTGPSYTLYVRTNYTYDGGGRVLTSAQSGNSNTQITTTYDSLGRKIRLDDPDSGTWEYRYDAAGNLTVQQDPETRQHVQFCYDPLNRVSKKLYLADDSLTAVNCGVTTSEVIEYTYDTGPAGTYPIGRLSSVSETHPNGDVGTTMTYDARGRVLSEGKTITVNSVPKTETTSFQYDSSDTSRVWKTTYPDGELVVTAFDHSGQPQMVGSATSYVSSAQYDVFGRPTSIVHGNGTTDTRGYYGQPGAASFPSGHRLQVLQTYPTATPNSPYLNLNYTDYTPRGLLWHLTDTRDPSDALSNTAEFVYDDLGRLLGVTNSPNMTGSYGYNSLGNLTAKDGQTYTYGVPTKPHQATQAGATALQYDSNGNQSLGRNGQFYQFDKDDHLEDINSGAVKFLYDYTGRRVAKLVGASATRYYNPLLEGTDGQLTKYYFIAGLRVAAQRINASQYALAPDAAVQVAAVSGMRPAVILLVRRDVQLGMALSVVVLGGGLLVAPWRRKRVVGIALRHGQVIVVVLAFGLGTLPWPLFLRPLGPSAAAAQTPPLFVHFHVDHLGSTQVITQSDGSIFRQIRYKAYGELRGHYNASGAPAGDCSTDRYCHEFTGYDTEPISGLDYAGARFYDPGLSLFLNHDPVRAFASPYSYLGGDPVNDVDVNGAFPWLFVALSAAFTFVQVGSKTGNTTAALIAGGIAAVTAGVTSSLGESEIIGSVVQQLLTPTQQYAVALAVGAYGTYQSAQPSVQCKRPLGSPKAAMEPSTQRGHKARKEASSSRLESPILLQI